MAEVFDQALGTGLGELAVLPLAELGGVPLCGDGDVVAAVTTRFSGPIDGTAIVALEPEDALHLVQGLAPGRQPIDAFVELGDALARARS